MSLAEMIELIYYVGMIESTVEEKEIDTDGSQTSVKMRKGLLITLVFTLILTVPVGIGASRLGWAFDKVLGTHTTIPLTALAVFTILFTAFSMIRPVGALWFRICMWVTGLYACVLAYFIPSMTSASIVLICFGQRWSGTIKPMVMFIIAIGSIVTVIYGFIYARFFHYKYYKKNTGKLNKSYRIVQISDTHVGGIIGPHYIGRMVKKINALDADMIVITGDIFNHGGTDECRDIGKVTKEFADLKAKDGVFAVKGNHDPDEDDPGMAKFIRDTGIVFIDNNTYENDSVTLVGRTGLVTDYSLRTDMKDLMERVDGSKPVVVLDHDPRGADDASEYGADVVFSGHTHRGQFFPMTALSKRANKKNYFYGRVEFGKTTSICSSGAGSFQLPIRVGTNSEIVCMDLS